MLLSGRTCPGILSSASAQRLSTRCSPTPALFPAASRQHRAARLRIAPLRRAQEAATSGGDGGGAPPAAPPLAERLRRLGLAGLLAYGLLNTAYYSVAFSLLWLSVSQRGVGLQSAAQRSVGMLAACWAASQLSKPLRLGGAVMLAPVARALLNAMQSRLGLREGSAFAVLVAAALLFAAALYAILLALAA